MLHLELDPRSNSQTVLVRCSGRIIFLQEAKELAETVRPLIERYERTILDLQGVRDVDSCGLGTLISLHLTAQEKNHSLTLVNPARAVAELLEITRLDRELQVRRHMDAANACAA